MNNLKPLGRKGYGSIPHLPNSRMGPADHSCHEGQFRICCEKKRDKHDRIIVTEKLDGSCVTIAKHQGQVLAVARSGYLAATSPFEHLHKFAEWVELNKSRFASIPEGNRICGEWLAMAHGTVYDLHHEPFVAFDVIEGEKRWPHDTARHLFSDLSLVAAAVVHDGEPISVEAAINALGPFGKHNATETIEGAVWRVERKRGFDFMAKWVRPDKTDGKYLPNLTGEPPIWLSDPVNQHKEGV